LELVERCPEDRRGSGIAVEFVPLDEDLRPCGSNRTAVARELSKHCIALLAEASAETRYLRVRLPGADKTKVLFEVLRCEQFGCFFEIVALALPVDPPPAAAWKEKQRDRGEPMLLQA
jgi:hypothetical protein